jgi:hypothetical protein
MDMILSGVEEGKGKRSKSSVDSDSSVKQRKRGVELLRFFAIFSYQEGGAGDGEGGGGAKERVDEGEDDEDRESGCVGEVEEEEEEREGERARERAQEASAIPRVAPFCVSQISHASIGAASRK